MKDQKDILAQEKERLEELMTKIQNFEEYDNLDSLIVYCNEAISLAKKHRDAFAMVKSYNFRGFAFYCLNKTDLAIENYQKSLGILEQNVEVQKRLPLSTLYTTLGFLFKIKHDFSSSLVYFVQALDDDFGIGLNQSRAYNNLALLYREVKDLDRAQNYLEYAIEIESQSEKINFIQKIRYQINLASIYELQGDLRLALKLLESVKEQCLRSKDYEFIIALFRGLGSVYIKLGEYFKAEIVVLQAMDLTETKQVRVELVQLNLLYSEILKFKGSLNECYIHLNQALSIAEKSSPEKIDKVLLGLQNYYKDINDRKNHFEIMKRRFALSKRTFEKEVKDDFWKLKASFQLEETERQLTLNRKRNMELEKKNSELVESLRSQRYIELRLLALQQHLCPEFIISKLQTIQELIIGNRNLFASDCLVDFASLMRSILKSSREDRLSLREEVVVLKNLVTLEQMKAENLFDFVIDIDPKLNLDEVFPPSLVFISLMEQAIQDVKKLKAKSQICFVVRRFKEDVFFHFYTKNETANARNLEEHAEEFETKHELIQRNRARLSKTMDKFKYYYRKSRYLSNSYRVYSILLVDSFDK